MSTPPLRPSLMLLIGRQIFDGAAPEALAEKHGVSATDVNQAWFDCRERLSRHFAEKEGFEYRLLNDNELQARLTDAIRMLLDWSEAEKSYARIWCMS